METDGCEKPKKHFKWIDMVSSSKSGETSASGFCGVIACVSSIILLFVLIVFYMFHLPEAGTILSLIDKLMLLFGIGASLLGVRKVSTAFSAKMNKEALTGTEALIEANKQQAKS